jgi:hypothetical protein
MTATSPPEPTERQVVVRSFGWNLVGSFGWNLGEVCWPRGPHGGRL